MTEWLKTQDYDHDIVDINIEGNEEVIKHYGIRSVPTLVMLSEDESYPLKTITGFSVPKLEAFLKI
jgi:hypothetical protein